jgi:hypothetical protein
MNDLTSWIAAVVGGGGALTVLAGGILYVTKEAIAKAVTQAGDREIERLKGALAKELEKEKHTFAKELEREKQEAAHALELFKAQLSLSAELRRQVATARVKAAGAIVQKATAVLSCFGAAQYSDAAKILGTLPAEEPAFRLPDLLLEQSTIIRDSAHLFPTAVAARFGAYAQAISELAGKSQTSPRASRAYEEAFPRVKLACEQISALAREQLGVLDAERLAHTDTAVAADENVGGRGSA